MADVIDELLGPGEVAARVGYSLSGLRRLERLGIIPPAPRMAGNGRRVYRRSDLEAVEESIKQRRADLSRSSEAVA